MWGPLGFWHIIVGMRFCDYFLQKKPQRKKKGWAGRWWDTGLTLLGLGKWTSHLPPYQMFEDENLTGYLRQKKSLTSRNPNGKGLPLWPAYRQSEEYLQLDLNISVGQRLKELELKFWTETLPLMMTSSGALLASLSSSTFLFLLLPFIFSFAPWEVIFV